MDNRLAELRATHHLTQAALAESLGVSRQTVISIEGGRFDPSLPLAFKIAGTSKARSRTSSTPVPDLVSWLAVPAGQASAHATPAVE